MPNYRASVGHGPFIHVKRANPITLSGQSVGLTIGTGPSSFVEPSNYPLELIAPRAVSTAPSADSGTPLFPSGHRCLKAYPGIQYRYKCDVIGGSFPYTFSISNAPSGMDINASTGVITWTNPQANATPTITVTDAEGTVRTGTPTITVTTAGFKFISPTGNDTTGTGTLAAPWQTFEKMKTTSAAGDICYFRGGTYTTNLSPDSTGGKTGEFQPPGNWARLDINSASRSVRWIAYPGESVIFDGGCVWGVTQGVLLRVTGSSTNPIYMDGIEFRNYYHIVFQLGIAASAHYDKFCNLNVHDVIDSIDGSNSSCNDSLSNSGGPPRYYVVYQDNNYHDNQASGIKIYWQYKCLWDGCQFLDSGGAPPSGGSVGAAGPDHKAACGRFEVRLCTFRNQPPSNEVPDINGASNDSGIGGNQNASNAVPNFPASGECRYNKIGGFARPGLRIVDMNNFSNSGSIFFYRNTGVGRWNVENSSTGGPFTFYRNVIINDVNSGDPDRISSLGGARASIVLGTGVGSNLSGGTSAGIVDSNLNLQGAFLASYGPTTSTPKGAQY